MTNQKSPTALFRIQNRQRHWFRVQLEMQGFCCPFETDTHRRNRESGGYPKGSNFLFYFDFYCLYCYFTNFFIRTDCVDLDSNLWNESLRKMALDSWYLVQMLVPKVMKLENSQKTYSQSSQYLWQDIMECILPPIIEEDKKPKYKKEKIIDKILPGKIQYICLFFTQEEKLKLKCWMGTA